MPLLLIIAKLSKFGYIWHICSLFFDNILYTLRLDNTPSYIATFNLTNRIYVRKARQGMQRVSYTSFQHLDKIKRIIRKVEFELSVVAQFHKQAAKQVGTREVIAVGLHTPRIGAFLGHRCLILHNETSAALLKLFTESGALFILLLQAELHGINHHRFPILAAILLLIAHRGLLYLEATLAVICDTIHYMVTDHVVAKVPESGFHLEPGFQYRNSITFLRNK